MSQRAVIIACVSSGIGFGLAKEFANRGWKVYVGACRVTKMESLEALGVHVLYFDISHKQSIDESRSTIDNNNKGRLAVLYLNAGISLNGSMFDMSMDDLTICFDTNVLGPIMRIRFFQRLLITSQAAFTFTSTIAAHNASPFVFPHTS